MKKEVRACFILAEKDEKKGKKHKGLLISKPNDKIGKEYIAKARKNLQLCDVYREKKIGYKNTKK